MADMTTMKIFVGQGRDDGDGSFVSGKKFRGMLLRDEGTEDLSSNDDDHHDDNCDDGSGGNLSEPLWATGSCTNRHQYFRRSRSCPQGNQTGRRRIKR